MKHLTGMGVYPGCALDKGKGKNGKNKDKLGKDGSQAWLPIVRRDLQRQGAFKHAMTAAMRPNCVFYNTKQGCTKPSHYYARIKK